MERIPLLSLEVIRGNQTYRIQGHEYALVVALTSRDTAPVTGLKHLHMPKLKGKLNLVTVLINAGKED